MSASPIGDSACRSCGEELAPSARFCPSCGAPVADLPLVETVPGPVVQESVERRWLGLPARFVLLCLGFAALGGAIGLFATGSWGWGIGMLVLGAILLAALGEATRRSADVWAQHSSRLAADGRAHAATAAEVWRTRLDTALTRWRTRSRLDAITYDRGPALQALGEAVWRRRRERRAPCARAARGARAGGQAHRGRSGRATRGRRREDSPGASPGTGDDDGYSKRTQRSISAAGRGEPTSAGAGAGAVPAARMRGRLRLRRLIPDARPSSGAQRRR